MKLISWLIWKTLISRVLPGVALVRASLPRLVSLLIIEDFPTLLFPAKATSGQPLVANSP